MKPIFKNILNVIRRFKLATTLNILGLSVAFAVFMVIMMQLSYDYGFDKFQKDYDKIFRLRVSSSSLISRPLAESFFKSSPHIIAGTLIIPQEETTFFYIENKDVRNFFKEKSLTVSPEFTDVFDFDFVYGSENVLKSPDHVIIPLSLSRKIFGNEMSVGEQIFGEFGSRIIGAVYRDLPANSSIVNCIYFSIKENLDKASWNISNYHAYLRIDHLSNAPQLVENFKLNFDGKAVYGESFVWERWAFNLTALPDIHFMDEVNDNTPKASKKVLLILFVIALMIIAIAAINFINFSTALTPMRIKSINTHRVLGTSRHIIRRSLVFETVLLALLSYFIAVFLILLFHRLPLARIVDADLSVTAHPLIVCSTALIAAFTGLLAGIYPSRYMTSFAPAMVLKGSYGFSHKGKKIRNTLIGIQFFASFALIICASFMYLQNRFMQNSFLGYDKDNMIVVDIWQIRNSQDAYTNQLKSFSGIDEVSYSEFLLSSADKYMSWGGPYKGEVLGFQCIPVDYNFLKVMGIKITEGRDFRQEDSNKQTGAFIYNETARKKYNLEIGSKIESAGEIIGFIHDINFSSFRMEIMPMAFYVRGLEFMQQNQYYAYIKVKKGTNLRVAMSHIHATFAKFDSNYQFEVRFFDEVLQRLYEKEISLNSLISLFSMIAIFISIVGVFGLVVFDSECRRKEIGIRKVLGASTFGIIIMFNKIYLRILMICFVIAAPLAWYAVHRWLENFAFKTPMYWYVYLLAFFTVAIITACTVTFQNWRVANDDPVKAIKIE